MDLPHIALLDIFYIQCTIAANVDRNLLYTRLTLACVLNGM